MLDILRGAPLWVYAVSFIVTYYGVLACFESRETKRSLQLTPLVFVTVSLFSLNLSQGVVTPLASYGASLAIGWFAAFHFYSYRDVGRKGNSLVMVYWVFFAWRYYSGYHAEISPETVNDISIITSSSLASGLIKGLIVGRSFMLLRFFKVDKMPVQQIKP